MAPSKKPTNQELLERKREQERDRYRKIKLDPVQSQIQKEKERKKYNNKKKKKQVKLVADMTPREHRLAKKEWRERKMITRIREKAERNVMTPMTPPDNEGSQENQLVLITPGLKRIQRDRSRIIQRNKQLLKEVAILKKQRDKYRKRCERVLQRNDLKNCPRTIRIT